MMNVNVASITRKMRIVVDNSYVLDYSLINYNYIDFIYVTQLKKWLAYHPEKLDFIDACYIHAYMLDVSREI